MIQLAPFEETRAACFGGLDAPRAPIRDEGLGIEIGRVTVRGEIRRRSVEVDGPSACRGSGPVSALGVRCVHRIRGFTGYGCPPGRGCMSAERDLSAAHLFPHEVGHVRSVSHTASGPRHPRGRFSGLSEGELFRAHVDARSSLVLSFGRSPGAGARLCGFGAGCRPRDFELGPGGAS